MLSFTITAAYEFVDIFPQETVQVSGQIGDLLASHIETERLGNVIDQVSELMLERVQEFGVRRVKPDHHDRAVELLVRIGKSGVHVATQEILPDSFLNRVGALDSLERMHDLAHMIACHRIEDTKPPVILFYVNVVSFHFSQALGSSCGAAVVAERYSLRS